MCATDDNTCALCDGPATKLIGSDEHDPYCDACYLKAFEACPNCGEEVPKDAIHDVQVYRQTWDSPAEYDTVCEKCGGASVDGPDPDEAYERWRDAKYDQEGW